jgi:phosphatidylglycerophosphatase A
MLAFPLALLVDPVWLEAVLVGALVAVGVWAAAPFADGDPGWVVIDETAGGWLAIIGSGGWPLVVGWVVFRVADITKWPPGVRQAESLGGAWGVMADDLVSGLYGLAAALLVGLL